MENICPQCGSPIQGEAKFCQKCGSPTSQASPGVPSDQPPGQPTTPPPQPPPPYGQPMMGGEPNKLKAAALGGLVAGILSGIPFVQAGNVCCCLWVILGGVIAVYLYSRQVPVILGGTAALLGLQSGMMAAVVATLLSIPIRLMTMRFVGTMQREIMEKMIEQNPDFPPALRDFMLQLFSPEFTVGLIIFSFILSLVLYSLFGALGGLIGNALFKKK